MVNGEKEESVGETPTAATETVALPGKSLMIGGAGQLCGGSGAAGSRANRQAGCLPYGDGGLSAFD